MPPLKQGIKETPFEAGGLPWLLRETKVRSIRCDAAPGGRLEKTLRKADDHVQVAEAALAERMVVVLPPAGKSAPRLISTISTIYSHIVRIPSAVVHRCYAYTECTHCCTPVLAGAGPLYMDSTATGAAADTAAGALTAPLNLVTMSSRGREPHCLCSVPCRSQVDELKLRRWIRLAVLYQNHCALRRCR